MVATKQTCITWSAGRISQLHVVAFALASIVQTCQAADLHVATTAEEKHKRPFWSIGEGFEGSPSDYTEYVVWGIGVVGVFYYLMNPNARRNLHAVEGDEPLTTFPHEEDEPGMDNTTSEWQEKKKSL